MSEDLQGNVSGIFQIRLKPRHENDLGLLLDEFI